MIAYIRDFALSYYFLGESFETFAPWSQIETIITETKATIRHEHEKRCLPGKPFIGCRVTQLYHEGACLYFYFCMNFAGVPNASSVYSEIERAGPCGDISQWWIIKSPSWYWETAFIVLADHRFGTISWRCT